MQAQQVRGAQGARRGEGVAGWGSGAVRKGSGALSLGNDLAVREMALGRAMCCCNACCQTLLSDAGLRRWPWVVRPKYFWSEEAQADVIGCRGLILSILATFRLQFHQNYFAENIYL